MLNVEDFVKVDNLYCFYPDKPVTLDIPYSGGDTVQGHMGWPIGEGKIKIMRSKAKEWASQRHNESMTNAINTNNEHYKPTEKKLKNDPFTIRVIGFEQRKSFASVYKVLTSHDPQLIFDMDIDVMDFCVFKFNIKRGFIDADFVFAKRGNNEIKLQPTPLELLDYALIKDILE